MRFRPSYPLAAYTLGILVLLLEGCASTPPAKFYQLTPMGDQPGQTRSASNQGGEVVSVGPLRIPDYLDRPQIVSRSGNNAVILSEFDRWAGSVENDIVRVLVEDMSAKLPPDRFFVIRWTPLLDSQLSSSYRVELIVNRFEGPLNGTVTLNASWGVQGKDRKMLLYRESAIVEQTNGTGYGAYVDALSRAVDRLSKEIADGIVSKAAVHTTETEGEKGG